MPDPALSFVIPLYSSAETIGPLVKTIEALVVEGGHEIVLVNDGSRDGTAEVCRRLVVEAGFVPVERDTVYRRVERDAGNWATGWRVSGQTSGQLSVVRGQK